MVPSYFEILKTHPEVFLDKHTYQFFQLVFFYDIDENNKAQEAEKIYVFMNEMRQMCAPGTESKFAKTIFHRILLQRRTMPSRASVCKGSQLLKMVIGVAVSIQKVVKENTICFCQNKRSPV